MADSDLIDALRTALGGTRGLASAYLFGSAAEGRLHRESDVDVAVLLDRAVYPSAAHRFEARLSLLGALGPATRREIDLVVLNDAPPHLARHIMTTGKSVIVADPVIVHAHLRMVLSRAADLEPFLRRTRALKLGAITP
jgi:predicted nucleotidyltransferase